MIKLAKTVTDLRIEDWDDRTAEHFIERLKDYKRTAEEFSGEATTDNVAETSSYALTFVDDAGNAVTKRFEKVEQSKRGKLLMNGIPVSHGSGMPKIAEGMRRLKKAP